MTASRCARCGARDGAARVTNAELLFDLVYVFAVTQLSHHLIGQPTVEGAVQTLILLGLVWEAWAYTMWTTNWLDPDQVPVRAMLFATGVRQPGAVAGDPARRSPAGAGRVAGAYAAMQIGRSVFTIFALRDDASLRRNYERILCWCLVSGALALVGAGVDGHARELFWAAAVVVDVLGGVTGFYTPGLGRSSTTEWTVDGGHLAERCHAFVLIALGESIVVLGATLSDLDHIGATDVAVFVFGFLGVIALWWIYFARSAESAAEVIANAADPGRIARAYHELHPVMIAGIIVIAAADELVLQHPLQRRRPRPGPCSAVAPCSSAATPLQGLSVAGPSAGADRRAARPDRAAAGRAAHRADRAGRVRFRRPRRHLHQRCGVSRSRQESTVVKSILGPVREPVKLMLLARSGGGSISPSGSLRARLAGAGFASPRMYRLRGNPHYTLHIARAT